MKLRFLLLPILLVSGLGLSACGSSVNTNSKSYQDGYNTGYSADHINFDENFACGSDNDFNNPMSPHYNVNISDFTAGCHAGWIDGQ
jgi:hypothetical protein